MGQSERPSMDSHMRLMRAALESGKPLSWSSVKDGIDHAGPNLHIAAYATGVAETALAGAGAYAQVREHSGNAIGSFLAIRERESVVEGKTVAGRVRLGGRRSNKK